MKNFNWKYSDFSFIIIAIGVSTAFYLFHVYNIWGRSINYKDDIIPFLLINICFSISAFGVGFMFSGIKTGIKYFFVIFIILFVSYFIGFITH